MKPRTFLLPIIIVSAFIFWYLGLTHLLLVPGIMAVIWLCLSSGKNAAAVRRLKACFSLLMALFAFDIIVVYGLMPLIQGPSAEPPIFKTYPIIPIGLSPMGLVHFELGTSESFGGSGWLNVHASLYLRKSWFDGNSSSAFYSWMFDNQQSGELANFDTPARTKALRKGSHLI